MRVDFINEIMNRCYVSNYSNEEFRQATLGRLTDSESNMLRLYMRNEKDFTACKDEIMQKYSNMTLTQHAQMYFKYRLPSNSGEIASYWLTILDTSDGETYCYWIVPFCVCMSILKGWHKKIGCALITGKSNSGKTQIFCKPFQEWVRPFVPLRCDTSDFAFEEVSTFHALWYIDESDQLAYTGKILEGLKNVMGRQQFAVNRKYKSGSVSMRKPGIFMKQKAQWPGVEGSSLEALQNRYYHIDMDRLDNKFPDKMCHKHWAMFWATLCIVLDNFTHVKPDCMDTTELYFQDISKYICRAIERKLSNLAELKTYEDCELQSIVSTRNAEIL